MKLENVLYACATSDCALVCTNRSVVASLGWFELSGSWNLAIFIPADVACQVCPAVDKVP